MSVEPITPGVVPELDAEREFIDYMAVRVRAFVERYGAPPHAAAVVLMSADYRQVVPHSWSLDGVGRFPTCSVAAVALTDRALVEMDDE